MPLDERIVSEKVLGSSNPVARFGRNVSRSISGIFFGIMLIIAAFGVLWWGSGQKNYSQDVAALPLQAMVAADQSGMAKIQAVPALSNSVTAPVMKQAVVYYEYKKQEFKKVKEMRTETRTVQRDGKDVQQQVEKEAYVDKWFDVASDKNWAQFSVGGASVNPTSASLSYLDLQTLYDKETPVSTNTQLDVVQKTREVVKAFPIGPPLLVVGAVAGDTIASGEPFIISSLSSDGLTLAMQKSESTRGWIIKVLAWLLMTCGAVLLFGPIATLLNILPGLGKLFNGILFLVFGVISAIVVMVASWIL